jgi:putative PIN family toxin of toxin-antitoxin system
MLKIILDTNVVVSAFVFGGRISSIIEALLESKYELIVCEDLKKEVYRIMVQKFKASFGILEKIQNIFYVSDSINIERVFDYGQSQKELLAILKQRDPKDVYLVELAFQSKTSVIVSGDKDLLELNSIIQKFGNVDLKILKPSEFVDFLESLK